jgi:hypothetical protein
MGLFDHLPDPPQERPPGQLDPSRVQPAISRVLTTLQDPEGEETTQPVGTVDPLTRRYRWPGHLDADEGQLTQPTFSISTSDIEQMVKDSEADWDANPLTPKALRTAHQQMLLNIIYAENMDNEGRYTGAGLPYEVALAILEQESGYDSEAKEKLTPAQLAQGHQPGLGLMGISEQIFIFMKADVDKWNDPETNIRTAVGYLGYLARQYTPTGPSSSVGATPDWDVVIAAFNRGEPDVNSRLAELADPGQYPQLRDLAPISRDVRPIYGQAPREHGPFIPSRERQLELSHYERPAMLDRPEFVEQRFMLGDPGDPQYKIHQAYVNEVLDRANWIEQVGHTWYEQRMLQGTDGVSMGPHINLLRREAINGAYGPRFIKMQIGLVQQQDGTWKQEFWADPWMEVVVPSDMPKSVWMNSMHEFKRKIFDPVAFERYEHGLAGGAPYELKEEHIDPMQRDQFRADISVNRIDWGLIPPGRPDYIGQQEDFDRMRRLAAVPDELEAKWKSYDEVFGTPDPETGQYPLVYQNLTAEARARLVTGLPQDPQPPTEQSLLDQAMRTPGAFGTVFQGEGRWGQTRNDAYINDFKALMTLGTITGGLAIEGFLARVAVTAGSQFLAASARPGGFVEQNYHAGIRGASMEVMFEAMGQWMGYGVTLGKGGGWMLRQLNKMGRGAQRVKGYGRNVGRMARGRQTKDTELWDWFSPESILRIHTEGAQLFRSPMEWSVEFGGRMAGVPTAYVKRFAKIFMEEGFERQGGILRRTFQMMRGLGNPEKWTQEGLRLWKLANPIRGRFHWIGMKERTAEMVQWAGAKLMNAERAMGKFLKDSPISGHLIPPRFNMMELALKQAGPQASREAAQGTIRAFDEARKARATVEDTVSQLMQRNATDKIHSSAFETAYRLNMDEAFGPGVWRRPKETYTDLEKMREESVRAHAQRAADDMVESMTPQIGMRTKTGDVTARPFEESFSVPEGAVRGWAKNEKLGEMGLGWDYDVIPRQQTFAARDGVEWSGMNMLDVQETAALRAQHILTTSTDPRIRFLTQEGTQMNSPEALDFIRLAVEKATKERQAMGVIVNQFADFRQLNLFARQFRSRMDDLWKASHPGFMGSGMGPSVARSPTPDISRGVASYNLPYNLGAKMPGSMPPSAELAAWKAMVDATVGAGEEGWDVSRGAAKQYIDRIRRLLEESPGDPELIRLVKEADQVEMAQQIMRTGTFLRMVQETAQSPGWGTLGQLSVRAGLGFATPAMIMASMGYTDPQTIALLGMSGVASTWVLGSPRYGTMAMLMGWGIAKTGVTGARRGKAFYDQLALGTVMAGDPYSPINEASGWFGKDFPPPPGPGDEEVGYFGETGRTEPAQDTLFPLGMFPSIPSIGTALGLQDTGYELTEGFRRQEDMGALGALGNMFIAPPLLPQVAGTRGPGGQAQFFPSSPQAAARAPFTTPGGETLFPPVYPSGTLPGGRYPRVPYSSIGDRPLISPMEARQAARTSTGRAGPNLRMEELFPQYPPYPQSNMIWRQGQAGIEARQYPPTPFRRRSVYRLGRGSPFVYGPDRPPDEDR